MCFFCVFIEAADNINATTVKISEVSNHTGQIMIKWESPKNPNGLIVTFEIEYWKTNLVDVSKQFNYFFLQLEQLNKVWFSHSYSYQ